MRTICRAKTNDVSVKSPSRTFVPADSAINDIIFPCLEKIKYTATASIKYGRYTAQFVVNAGEYSHFLLIFLEAHTIKKKVQTIYSKMITTHASLNDATGTLI